MTHSSSKNDTTSMLKDHTNRRMNGIPQLALRGSRCFRNKITDAVSGGRVQDLTAWHSYILKWTVVPSLKYDMDIRFKSDNTFSLP